MKINYEIKGLSKFLKNISKKPRVMRERVDHELSRSALRVEHNAKILAPWDTGWMSNNIYSDKEDFLKYRVVSPAEYSIFVERGTRHQRAQPFFFIALEDEYPRLMKSLQKIVKG